MTPQVVFAVESMLDDAATALGIDPVEIRLRNAAREGDANPLTGKRIYSAGLPECLEKGRKIFEWEKLLWKKTRRMRIHYSWQLLAA